jgi:hypothetical protein
MTTPTKTEISNFSLLIETISADKRLSKMDAILWHCEQTGLEVDLASKLLTSALKAKIREEAQDLNLLKRTAKLPI